MGPYLTYQQAKQYAQAAGFSGTGLYTILAIAQRESYGQPGLNPQLDVTAQNPGGAFGLFQFNPNAGWPTPTAIEAQFAQAFQASQGGTNFEPWTCDTECGFPKGQGVTPTSPQTVIGTNGQTLATAALADLTGQAIMGPTGPSGGQTGPGGSSGPLGPQGPSSGSGGTSTGTPPSILQAPLAFFQNIGVGVVGVAILIGGFLILAAPTINSDIVQPAISSGKKAAIASVA